MSRLALAGPAMAVLLLAASALDAQWLKQPTAGIPRTEMLEYICNENEKDLAHLVGKASDEKKLAVTVAPGVLTKYVGRYTFKAPDDPNQVMRFNVTLNDGTLSLDIGGKDKQEMIPLSETTFSVMGIRLDFFTDHLIFHIVEGDMKATKDK